MNTERANHETVMEVASALTVLGEEGPKDPKKKQKEETDQACACASSAEGSDGQKRYLPDHKKPDAAPTFPEKVSSQLELVLS